MTPSGETRRPRIQVRAQMSTELVVDSSPRGGIAFGLPTVVTVADLDGCDFDVTLELDAVDPDERLGITRLEVRAREGGPVVTAQALRTIPFGKLADLAARHAAQVFEYAPDGSRQTRFPPRRRPDSDEVKAAVRRLRGPTGSRTTPAEMARIKAAVEGAEQRGRVRAVMALGYSKSAAQRHLRAGRKAGLIPHTARSRRA